jgi:hypothetical protein
MSASYTNYCMLVSPFFTQAMKKWTPATDNLFEVRLVDNGADFDIRQYAILHCTKVRFASSGVEFTRNKTTKKFQIESYQHADEITITWREDKNLSVRRYHEEWQAKFYDRYRDCFLSSGCVLASEARSKLLKKLTVVVQASPEKVDYSTEEFPTTRTLILEDVLPPLLPELELAWDSGNGVEYTLTYKVGGWYWES